jgi:hypothetical protein
LFDRQNCAATIKATMSAGAVRHDRFTAVRASAPLRLGQAVMRTALVFHPLRSSSFRYRHRLSPVFLRAPRRQYLSFERELATDFERTEYRHSRIAISGGTAANLSIEIRAAIGAQPAAFIRTERPGG